MAWLSAGTMEGGTRRNTRYALSLNLLSSTKGSTKLLPSGAKGSCFSVVRKVVVVHDPDDRQS